MRNIKLTLAYDGSGYSGWQIQPQPGIKTVQGTLEQALEQLLGHKVKTNASGRTDAGVHAKGQVVNFTTDNPIPDSKLPIALNSIMPEDVVAIDCIWVEDDFHARYSAKKKRYRYTIMTDKIAWPFYRNTVYHFPRQLNVDEMKVAAEHIEGRYDFSSFCSSQASVTDFVREVYLCQISKEENFIYLDIEANGFLYNMVRIIVGTILEVGSGRLKADKISEIIEAKNRRAAGPTAPANGLCLEKVYY
ncbi:tRNA pseudouridine38-40 synthase [Desulfitispora alkaliphila]|uniref:tRNA pseudouridine(38-40) synthase TruA n=1 Tax=Desulfitispora alkaliphila TaxID=622674 RepID=UPI003D1FD873